ncbi:MAG: DUF262 domain-containing protein [Lachnospiraceae bacterium]|nr:DUF262 domain-containing protein [Lachnospiraceae bacterium]
MIKQVAHPTVSDIFAINSNVVYRIPKYQREYTWGINDWDALFNDVTENDYGYFLGSYICVNSGSLNGTTLEVIDGQQRFTTIMLLLTALYEKLNALKEQMDEDERTDLANLRSELANKKQTYTSDGTKKTEYVQRLILQKQNMNDEDFSFVLSDKGIITGQKGHPKNFGNRRISKAYKHFGKLIDEKVADAKEENPNINDVGALFGIVRKFENAIMVGIEVDANKDAYMLFESLNHRGVPLSALDLIKNTLIASAESKADADNNYEIWKQILFNVGQEDYSVQERFFRQYYNSFREELNAPYKGSDKKYYLGYLATRTTLLDIYEKMIKSDYKSLLDDLLQKSKIYALITNNSEDEYVYTTSLADLERIAGAPSYILLLYVMSNQDELDLADGNLDEIIKTLITFFVRRNVTDVPNTRKLTQLFIDIISEVKVLRGAEVVSAVREKLISVSATDEAFESKLRGSIYDENPEATRFILCSIEAQHQTKEIYSDLWARDNSNKYVWTIEHIFPEGENIPDAWVDMIAVGDKDRARQYRSDYVHTLGNLTITGYNQNLSNMSFEQKKDRKSKDKTKDMGYRNGLYLNQTVVYEDSWTIDRIKARTDMLVQTLKDMYKW